MAKTLTPERLAPYTFPVIERPVAVSDGRDAPVDFADKKTYLDHSYKALVRPDTNEVISIVKSTYKVVENREVLDRFFGTLDKLGHKYEFGNGDSFVTNQRMRLHIKYPEFVFQGDKESPIFLSSYLHNSYDMSEGVRIGWGIYRQICSNGAIVGYMLGKFYHRHTEGVNMDGLEKRFDMMADNLPKIHARVQELQTQTVDDVFLEKLKNEFSKRMMDKLAITGTTNRWAAYNAFTYHVSHEIPGPRREAYQTKISKVFQL